MAIVALLITNVTFITIPIGQSGAGDKLPLNSGIVCYYDNLKEIGKNIWIPLGSVLIRL